jgi:lipopolysaccharide/colanic/teichoic acid biosynthesis glycosyltransferase
MITSPLFARSFAAAGSPDGARRSAPSAAVLAVMTYLLTMPLLAGLPRGGIIPVVRPSEALQLVVTVAAVAVGSAALINGERRQLRIQPMEWWLLATTVAASVLPLLWLVARARPVGTDELLAAFPFVKYLALYALVRCTVASEAAVALVIRAAMVAAGIVTAIAITQALGVGPVIDVLGRFFVSGAEDVVDGGRGTTTIGSSIATGAFLSMACGIALSIGWTTGAWRWIVLACYLGIGALASGQAGTVMALGVVVFFVARSHRRVEQLIMWGTPAAVLATIGLWPIVAARLADLDQNRGLPGSWVIRWNNISELYLPSLTDGGWLLGVSPNAIVSPPDVWRDAIYLESGYLWLLWVGGLPLLIAAVGFLVSAWRTLASITTARATTGGTAHPKPAGAADAGFATAGPYTAAAAIAARAAVAMIAVVSIIDPHLTLRAGADLFYVLLALGLAGTPALAPLRHLSSHWRDRLADHRPGITANLDPRSDQAVPRWATARLQAAEYTAVQKAAQYTAAPQSADGVGQRPELVLALSVRHEGALIGSGSLELIRHGSALRGRLAQPVAGVDKDAEGLVWRAIMLSADSLRLADITDPTDPGGEPVRIDRQEIRAAARLSRRLELDRANRQPSVYRPARRVSADAGTTPPGVRYVVGGGFPGWKRTIDLVGGGLALAISAPLWLICAALIRRADDGPILFRQVRIGSGGLPFQIYKFRTMYVNNDDSAHRLQNKLELQGDAEASKDEHDPRITPIGGRLRRTSLDELPQLLNVMRSEMSLVGPRPSLLWESELFPPATRRRLATRPGLTGLWQTNGRADVSMAEMLDLDLDYLDRMGPLLDVQCLAKTATAVVAGDGAR